MRRWSGEDRRHPARREGSGRKKGDVAVERRKREAIWLQATQVHRLRLSVSFTVLTVAKQNVRLDDRTTGHKDPRQASWTYPNWPLPNRLLYLTGLHLFSFPICAERLCFTFASLHDQGHHADIHKKCLHTTTCWEYLKLETPRQ